MLPNTASIRNAGGKIARKSSLMRTSRRVLWVPQALGGAAERPPIADKRCIDRLVEHREDRTQKQVTNAHRHAICHRTSIMLGGINMPRVPITNRACGQRFVVTLLQHGGQSEQRKQYDRCTYYAGGGSQQKADDGNRNGQPPRRLPNSRAKLLIN